MNSFNTDLSKSKRNSKRSQDQIFKQHAISGVASRNEYLKIRTSREEAAFKKKKNQNSHFSRRGAISIAIA